MGNALRDQLLKAGLVNEQQAKKAAKEKQKELLRQQGQGKAKQEQQDKLRAQQAAQTEKANRDRQLNQQRQEQAEKKALATQIRQLIEQNRQAGGEGDIAYNFSDRGKVKRLYVADAVRQKISAGQLAIVRFDQGYALVSAEIAAKISARDPESVVVSNEPKPSAASGQEAEDPYAQFQVPDDLIW